MVILFYEIFWFKNVGERCVLIPHRYESYWKPAGDVMLFIDGPMFKHELDLNSRPTSAIGY